MFDTAQTARASQSEHCASMSTDTPYSRAFRRAIEIVGSAERLASTLGSPVADIEAWAAGMAHPPAHAFLKAIDVIKGEWVPGGLTKY
jgi:hypothetical protein